MAHHHSHDNIDWDTRLQQLRAADDLTAPETAQLVGAVLGAEDRAVIEIGSGAGGGSAALAAALSRSGGQLTLVDGAPQLLEEAGARATEAGLGQVEVRTVLADAADDGLAAAVGTTADLVFAAFVVHHLPDQLAGLRRLAELVRPGGRLVLVEFGLEPRVLPWDLGLGEPGLEARLTAARDAWFREMRAEMAGSVRLGTGWPRALRDAGLTDVRTWSYLIDRPAPIDDVVLDAVLRRLDWLHADGEDRADPADLDTLAQLLDPAGPHYVGKRDDVYYLNANTVHLATRPA
ncbi:class I SAM-dependent methyltransferase [Saccharopolyspora sp. CA-218241]|uniref:class I SAM-dependent methyltransferase n=1 Tax=Saccharopolyspora sp. CA-218241 TaxID=3240027 RepID=UPI003D98FECF